MKDATMTDETVYDNNATVNSEVATEVQVELLDMSYIQVANNSCCALGDEDFADESQDVKEEGTPDGYCDVTIQVGPLLDKMRQICQQHVFKGGNGSFRALKPALECCRILWIVLSRIICARNFLTECIRSCCHTKHPRRNPPSRTPIRMPSMQPCLNSPEIAFTEELE
jgi:hypothetical protein